MTDPVPVPEAAVEAAKKAYAEAESSPKLIPCERCKGVGYHHGFGEQGHDPDWCLDCGGGGFALAAGEEDRPLRSALTAALPHLGWREDAKLKFGDRVTKTKGASWTGRVVGFYSTALTPIGYAVESENEPGSVQIYPEAALMPAPPPPSSKEDRT